MQAYATYVNEIVDAQQEKKDTLEWQSMKEIDKIDLNSSLNLNKQLNCTTNYVPLSNYTLKTCSTCTTDISK